MNVYDDFFKGINHEDWEFFAADFLGSLGFTILTCPSRGSDGGKDLLVEYTGTKYIVSCKHFIQSNKAVVLSDEQSIGDRVVQHGAQGFIGFYSTLISSGLADKLKGLQQNQRGFVYRIFDKSEICDFLPKIHSYVMQKYGLPAGNHFYMNVSPEQYQPLPCMKCEVDILSDDMILDSMAGFAITKADKKKTYIYGCKYCIADYCPAYWLDHWQGLHLEQLIGWDRLVKEVSEDASKENLLHADFFKNYFLHRAALMQRLYPSNWGSFPSIKW